MLLPQIGVVGEQLVVPATWASDESGETCRMVSCYWNTCGALLGVSPLWAIIVSRRF